MFTGEAAHQTEDGAPIFLCLAAGGGATPNAQSILAVVYWRREARCSFYTGGDGNPEAANKGFHDLLQGVAKHVRAMKLDHHGSTKEFNTEIGHPSPQTVRRPDER